MKIRKIGWENYRALADGEIDAQGCDVTISGRNGVGKSSIASILPFVLFGRITSKAFDDRGLTVDSQMPTATIEFDTVTLRRSVTPRNTNRTFINGEEVSATKFNRAVWELTGEAGSLLFNPFEFPNSPSKDQRDFLLKHFVEAGDIYDNTSDLKEKIKSLKHDADAIPPKINEIQKQLQAMPQVELSDLQAKLAERQAEFRQLHPPDLREAERLLRLQITNQNNRREELLKTYKATKTTCPTCGQSLPKDKYESTRKKITDEGRKVAAELERLTAELETMLSKNQFSVEDAQRSKQLQDEMSELNRRIAELATRDKLAERLNELTTRERELNARIFDLEGQTAAIRRARQQRLVDSEDKINSQFRVVKFKLFKLMANGEIKDDCAAMIGGVPFQNLSKGEKLKAALDVLLTFQTKFGREMPLFLDDAESYTSNSFVDIPNQKFLFKVTDADLRIEVEQ